VNVNELHAAINLERAASLIYDVIANAVNVNGGWTEFCERLNEQHEALVKEAKSLRQIAAKKVTQ
jgi:transaldolase